MAMVNLLDHFVRSPNAASILLGDSSQDTVDVEVRNKDIHGMTLIVSRGAGTWGPRMRLWRPGQILRVTLHRDIPILRLEFDMR